MKALILTGNPLSLWPDQGALREGLLNLDVIAHLEVFPSETSAWADFVLPAATGIESGEINRYAEDRRIVWIEKVIDPPGEARPDYWIWIELGKRLWYADVLKEEYKDPVRLWDETMRRGPQLEFPGRRGKAPRLGIPGVGRSGEEESLRARTVFGQDRPPEPAGGGRLEARPSDCRWS
jgi:anaerobic selenocysteine-containing dehydrogenase